MAGIEIINRSVQVGDFSIQYHEAGAGPAVIMIHGGGPGAGGLSNYQRNVDFLAQKYRVIMPDLPGYGGSSNVDLAKEKGPFTFYAQIVTGLMDALGVDKAHMVGNSLGGGVCTKVALDMADRTDRLVLMGAGLGLQIFTPSPTEGIRYLLSYYDMGGPSLEKLRQFLGSMVYDVSQLSDTLIEERFEKSLRPDIVAAPAVSLRNPPKPEPLWHRLSEIKAKTLLIWGREDRIVPLDNSFVMLNQINDVRLHVFSKCGHWAQWEKADEFNTLVSNFLNIE